MGIETFWLKNYMEGSGKNYQVILKMHYKNL